MNKITQFTHSQDTPEQMWEHIESMAKSYMKDLYDKDRDSADENWHRKIINKRSHIYMANIDNQFVYYSRHIHKGSLAFVNNRLIFCLLYNDVLQSRNIFSHANTANMADACMGRLYDMIKNTYSYLEVIDE